ncbi:MAG: alanine--tRNA ligase [Planctomycetota bacterium]|jgi:alanyl-tRNA synthetase
MPTTSIRTAAQIRQEFIDYFVQRHDHAFVPSSPVMPHGDPTLLFTNAGMNQFKDVFLGQGARPYRRAANTQKCIRAGGKHNDLEDVGKDQYHHTFFEMLGNWSFGDYFKAEAIEWAWELLTEVWGLDADRLYVTVFEGNAADGLEPDTEAEELWKRHVGPARISRWGKKDNFWEMGDTGPCGPCSEIHYDGRPDAERSRVDGADLVNREHPDVIEIWNLVFIQFNRAAGGALSPLPAKGVDTGMGFERLVRILQGKPSNYDTDIWTPILHAIESHTKAATYGGVLESPVDVAYRVIADHVRCLTVALTDGGRPSNEKAGYVLRRILRRAVRHAHQTLGVEGPLLCHLVPAVVESLGDAFPELKKNPAHVAEIIRDEEESFLRTLDRGLALFAEAADRAAATKRVDADDAFRLHDTFGFPIDLTRVMAEERGLEVDEAGFERLMDDARELSRRGGDEQQTLTLPPEAMARLKHLGIEPTRDVDKHHGRPITASIKAIWNGTDFDEDARSVGRPQMLALILDRTNFYAEQGGQVGDTGRIRDVDGDLSEYLVSETHVVGGYVLHIGRLTKGKLTVGEPVQLTIDRKRREPIRSNHTATHLLNYALRDVLGPDEDQKGSLVAPDRLRFDFSCTHAMSDEQIERTERQVNEAIDAKLPVDAELVPLDIARSITGLRAVFGEKYPDPVRVVTIGVELSEVLQDPSSDRWSGYSIELCGGTHLADTSGAGRFVITHEQALAAGVRRVTALTGATAEAALLAGRQLAERVEGAARLPDDRLGDEVDQINAMLEQATLGVLDQHRIAAALEPLRERVRRQRKQEQAASRSDVLDRARALVGRVSGPVIVEHLDGASRDDLLPAMDVIRAGHEDAAVMLLTADEEDAKVFIAARVPKPLIGRGLKAGDWVREAAKACGGGGGGRPDMAQAGGKDPAKVDAAIETARAFARGHGIE